MGAADSSTEFPVARCTACGQDVLCYDDLSDSDLELMRCLDCSHPIDPSSVRWFDLRGIEALGYGLVSPEQGCGPWGCARNRCGSAEPPVGDQG